MVKTRQGISRPSIFWRRHLKFQRGEWGEEEEGDMAAGLHLRVAASRPVPVPAPQRVHDAAFFFVVLYLYIVSC